jgi:hypothetical protein
VDKHGSSTLQARLKLNRHNEAHREQAALGHYKKKAPLHLATDIVATTHLQSENVQNCVDARQRHS